MQRGRIGIDLGGTKIEIIVLDEHGEEHLRRRTSTPQGEYQATLDAIQKLVLDAEAELNMLCTVGVAMPGAFSVKTGRIKNSNSVCLNGQNLKADLDKRLQRSCCFSNDANCFALSEAIDGAGQDARSVFAVIIGTGTGAGIVINNQLLVGANAIAGEWGHNPLPWPRDDERPGATCYCGKQGCIETFLSGTGMSRDHFEICGQRLSTIEIVEQSGTNSDCERTLQRYEDRLARGLAHVINILDPDVIVLGGGLSNIARLYQNVPVRLSDYVFSDSVETRVLPPKHGDSSGVRGAAWLGGKPGEN